MMTKKESRLISRLFAKIRESEESCFKVFCDFVKIIKYDMLKTNYKKLEVKGRIKTNNNYL